jgi:hypothetical protein
MPGTLHAPAACPKAVCWKMLEIVVLLIEGALALLLVLVYPNQIQSFLERERDIYDSMEWSWLQYSNSLKPQLRVGSSTTQHLSFFLGGSSPPSTRTRRRHCQRKQRKQSKDDPGGFLLGHE